MAVSSLLSRATNQTLDHGNYFVLRKPFLNKYIKTFNEKRKSLSQGFQHPTKNSCFMNELSITSATTVLMMAGVVYVFCIRIEPNLPPVLKLVSFTCNVFSQLGYNAKIYFRRTSYLFLLLPKHTWNLFPVKKISA